MNQSRNHKRNEKVLRVNEQKPTPHPNSWMRKTVTRKKGERTMTYTASRDKNWREIDKN